MIFAGRLICGVLVASSAAILVASAVAISAAKRRRTVCSRSCSNSQLPVTRECFTISRARAAADRTPKWILRGSGRYECFLLFDTWREAMDQATFRLETLTASELVQL